MSRSSSHALQVIRQWQSETDAIREAPVPGGPRRAVQLLALGLLAAGLSTPFIRLDRMVASTSAQITSTDQVIQFQSLDPSIIKSIEVKAGQQVKAGQVLATLDPTFAEADVEQLHQQIAALDAQIARAQAEQTRRPLAFDGPGSPLDAGYRRVQQALYEQRAAQLAAKLHSFDEKVQTTRATIDKLQGDETRFEAREQISQQIEAMRSSLYKSGSSSLLNLLEANDARIEMQRTRALGRNSLVEAQHQLIALEADREAALQEWLAQAGQELVTAQNQRDQAIASLSKASKHRDLVRLTAPEDSVVLSLSTLSVGSVLKAGDPIVSLVPLRSPMEFEIHLLPRDVGSVRPGDPAIIKIDAYNYYEHGTAQGHVKWISEGTFTDPSTNGSATPYYKARVAIDELNFINVPASFRLVPGMTGTADIKVGTRSVLQFILSGLLRGTNDEMRDR